MLRTTLLTAWLLIAGHAWTQEVVWADRVIEVSSEIVYPRAPGQYAAKEALGPPSVALGFGESECAWTPGAQARAGGERIVLGFPSTPNVQQIIIHENLNPGGITDLILIDAKGRRHVVYTNDRPGPLAVASRVWNCGIELQKYKAEAIEIRLNTALVPGYNQIDAVGLSTSAEPVEIAVRRAAGWNLVGETENLGPNINSVYNELCPVISADGGRLYFTRVGDPKNMGGREDQDVYSSAVREDGFSLARNLGRPINNAQNNSITSITPDGQTAALMARYEPDGSLREGISTARRQGEEFSYPQACEIQDYYNRSEYGEFCLASSGKVLVMTLQRDDSEGGKDLYITFLQANGKWSPPKSLGAQLNTAANETSPFLAADDRTLYFSSSGFPGYGRKDMFISRRLDDTWSNWSEPENLGPKLNTPNWDAYYSLPASGEYAYFVSYENSIGEADIFRAPLPVALRPLPVVLISGKVTDQKSGKPLAAEIVYESLETGEAVGVAHSDPRDGSYRIALPAGTHYGFLAQVEEFFPVSENIDLQEVAAYAEVTRDLGLVRPEKGATVVLNNLFFATGKAQLTPASQNELERLAAALEKYPTMVIEIAGHTDAVGSDSDNQKLSEQRAEAVKEFLLEAGVLAVRIQTRGYGESQPIVPNDSKDSRKRNRRVEFQIRQF
ncbi:MAG: OmpA family protein [Bacteroidota bacterium]